MSGEQILVVEDDPSILLGLDMNLTTEGYVVTRARDGAEAVARFGERSFDLVILDVMLPRMSGLDVLEHIRRASATVPVIFLSARDAQPDKVKALELGGDDYVTKPFGLPELLARIKVALRRRGEPRPPSTPRGALRVGEILIEPEARAARGPDGALELTAKEFDLLVLFARAAGRALSRGQILEAVWGDDYEGTERTVDNFVARLRAKIERDPDRPTRLETIRGVGYRLNVPPGEPR